MYYALFMVTLLTSGLNLKFQKNQAEQQNFTPTKRLYWEMVYF